MDSKIIGGTKEQVIPFPDKRYDIIYADPPWEYRQSGSRSAAEHYPTMSTEEICQLLCLRFLRKDGPTQTVTSETDGALLTEFLTLNTGESPNVVVESTLSSILETNAPEKYYLSARACEGILRRAERRGKQLPGMLRLALEQTIARENA